MQTEILVIGGGATGTGILRDLAMRGFDTILVERRDFTYGTTGRFHGLLHSGGRYVVKDPEAARECIEENRILRKIMPHCIEDTDGYFVLTPEDDPIYVDQFLKGCRKAGISAEEIPIGQMLDREPFLNSEISRCFQVPDGAADAFAAAHANVTSALEYGAQALTYHEVIHLMVEGRGSKTSFSQSQSSIPNHVPTSSARVVGALCHDLIFDQEVEIYADLIVNAAGAWVGKIGATAGIEIAIRPGKGTMIAVSHRIVNTVINRLKMPSDGDILVPAHTVAVMGTTDEQVPDPDVFAIEPWEIQHMLVEGEKIIPGFSQLRMLRAWAGVRPLYQETKTGQSRDITRSFVLLDHEERDGISGLLTITSGKWTTYRKMAEVTVDQVCQKLDTKRFCRTHLEELPKEFTQYKISEPDRTTDGKSKHTVLKTRYTFQTLGHRLAQIEHEKTYGDLICECELATKADIEHAITDGQAKTLDDIRRDVRLGMGPCQGGFCTLRAAGILHQILLTNEQINTIKPQSHVYNINASIRDFLQERWKGLLPILWGSQLWQESLNELIFLNLLNIDHLPGPIASRLGPDNYLEAKGKPSKIISRLQPGDQMPPATIQATPILDAITIGSGLAGLIATWQLALQGKKVRLVTKGWGATHWGSGCIDVLGYYPLNKTSPIDVPISAIARLTMEHPDHPYAKVSLKQIDTALKSFQTLCSEAGYPLKGSLENNWLLPTTTGALRPTCLAPETYLAGDLSDSSPMLLVGIKGFNDFYPYLTAANLDSQGIPAKAVVVEIPGLQNRQRIDSIVLAQYFDDLDSAFELFESIKPHVENVERIGFPAILGLKDPLRFVKNLESISGCRIFEIPGLPPSIPGMRLHRILINAIQRIGGQVFHGMEVISNKYPPVNGQIEAIFTEAAARPTSHTARNFILASGGILGGGISTDHHGNIFETIFDLPVQAPLESADWFNRDFLNPNGHPVVRAGVLTDENFKTAFDNLFAIGGTLPGDFVRERSLEGVAVVTGFRVAEILA